MDLDQLKAENAAKEAAQASLPTSESAQVLDGVVDGQDADDQDADIESGAEGTKADANDWMKSDEPAPHAEKKFTDGDIGAAKAKWRAKAEAKHQTELDALRAQLEEANARQQIPQQTARPTREQFYSADDPEDAYAEALVDWKMGTSAAQQQASRAQYELQRQQLEQKQATEMAVDQHYDRAAKLAETSGIEAETYQAADHRVRSMIEGLFPKGGDAVTDSLITVLGEGSERVMFNLGVNTARLNELKTLLTTDKSGLKAAMYLGKLSAEINAPAKRTSKAPAPASQAKGDASASPTTTALQRKYDAAHKAGNVGEAMTIKRQAQQAGANTKSW